MRYVQRILSFYVPVVDARCLVLVLVFEGETPTKKIVVVVAEDDGYGYCHEESIDVVVGHYYFR